MLRRQESAMIDERGPQPRRDDAREELRLRVALLDSWHQGAAEGSGTAVAIGGLYRELRRLGFEVVRIAPPARGWRARLPLTLRRLVFNLLLPLRHDGRRFDLVVGFDWDGVWHRRRAPYVCSIKGVLADELRHERGSVRLLFQLLARLEGANARRADRVLATSEYSRRRIIEHYGVPAERIGVVPEGIELAVRDGGADCGPAPASSADGLPGPPRTSGPGPPRVLCVARQYRRKHVDDLLRAFALVRERVPAARLRIVGDGPEHAKLRALARQLGMAQSAVFTGAIADEEVRREYEQCDVFCLPSVQEGFGIVFLEAMAAGKPVVATTAAAIPEVVQHGATGLLVSPGDVRALADALLLLLADAERRDRYGRAGRERAALYDWRRVAELFRQEVAPLADSVNRRREQ